MFTFDDFLVQRRYSDSAARIGKKYTKLIFDAGYTEEDIKRIDGYVFRDMMDLGSNRRTNPWSRAVGMYRSYLTERERRNDN